MKYPTVFHLLAAELGKAKIPFVLIGGFAVNYYQVTRFTGDVDILIAENNFQRVLPLLEQGGYQQVTKQHLFARFKREGGGFLGLDVMFVDERTFNRILDGGQKAKIEGAEFIVPSLNHLIALKLHSLKNNLANRENPDMTDIISLIQINQIDVTRDDFQTLCFTYGTKELYDKILRIITAWKKS